MSKGSKRGRRYRIKEYRRITKWDKVKANLSGFNWKLLLILLGTTAFFVLVFEVSILFEFAPIYPIYMGLLLAAVAAYALLNRGLGSDIPEKSQLSDKMTDAEKDAYLARLIRDKNIAKKLLLVIIPLLVVFAYDTMRLLVFEGMFR